MSRQHPHPDHPAGPTSPPGLALVTGASSGIGRAIAEELAGQGHDLVVCAEDDAIRETAAALDGATQVRAVQADLATHEGVEQLWADLDGAPLAVAVLNAGVDVGGSFSETALEDDLRLVDLNVRSTVHLAKLVVREMVRQGSGRLLFTASIASKAPGPYHSTYAASKAFVHSLAEGIRHELRGTGVTVTSLMPGPTDTEIFERAGMLDTRIGSGPKDDPREVAREAVSALLAGRDHVVSGGVKNKVYALAGELLPDRLVAMLSARKSVPGGAD